MLWVRLARPKANHATVKLFTKEQHFLRILWQWQALYPGIIQLLEQHRVARCGNNRRELKVVTITIPPKSNGAESSGFYRNKSCDAVRKK